MDYNNDFKYDLALGQLGEGWLGHLLSSKTIEVKFDFGCYRTGNFYIEYESRGKYSGITTTQADYWFLIAASEKGQRLKMDMANIDGSDVLHAVLIPTARLKQLCKTNYHRIGVAGGDNNTSVGILIKAKDLL